MASSVEHERCVPRLTRALELGMDSKIVTAENPFCAQYLIWVRISKTGRVAGVPWVETRTDGLLGNGCEVLSARMPAISTSTCHPSPLRDPDPRRLVNVARSGTG